MWYQPAVYWMCTLATLTEYIMSGDLPRFNTLTNRLPTSYQTATNRLPTYLESPYIVNIHIRMYLA